MKTPDGWSKHPAIPLHEFGILVDEATRLVGAGSRR